jgi:myo-inositol-1-phosphate synthase
MRIYIFGLHGIVSTTAIAVSKTLEMQKDMMDMTGLVSELPEFSRLKKIVPFEFDFGGCEIRDLKTSVYDIFLDHLEKNEHVSIIYYIDSTDYMKNIFPDMGTSLNCGEGVSKSFSKIESYDKDELELGEIVDKIEENLLKFADKDKENTVAINLASTEAPLDRRMSEEYTASLGKFEEGIRFNYENAYTASILYAYVVNYSHFHSFLQFLHHHRHHLYSTFCEYLLKLHLLHSYKIKIHDFHIYKYDYYL